MARYHINPETGNPGICKAEKQCRFGDIEDHYPTKEMAQQHYEFVMAEKAFDSFKENGGDAVPAATYNNWKTRIYKDLATRKSSELLKPENVELIKRTYDEGLKRKDEMLVRSVHHLVSSTLVKYGSSIKKAFDQYPAIIKDLSWIDVNIGILDRMDSADRKRKFWEEADKKIPAETLTYWRRTKPASAPKFKYPAPGPKKTYEDPSLHMQRVLGDS